MTATAPNPIIAPVCPGPDPLPHGPLSFTVPPKAVDTHAHVIGRPPAYPFVDDRSYTPPEATERNYLNMLDATGMTYGVLVQVSVHGTDNRLMRQTLRAHHERLRGIAVMPLSLPENEYVAAREDGVVGLRLNVLFGGGIGFDALSEYDALARDMGWHLQFLISVKDLPALAPAISKLRAPFVVDHMGHFPAERGVDAPGFRTLVELIRDGGWVKLSGAYRLSPTLPYKDTVALAQALFNAAPDRCVWGSDWPHVAHYGHMMNVGDLLETLAMWLPCESDRNRVLVDNAHRLYGF